MATATRKTTKPKTRTVGWIKREGPCRGIIHITVDGKRTCYRIATFECDWGFGVQVDNLSNGKSYDVNIDPAHGHCDCTSHDMNGTCKHREALAAMKADGRIN